VALIGNIDHVSMSGLHGWAQESEHPGARVSLLVTADDDLVGRVLANHYRDDLESAGIGDGRHAFTLSFDDSLLMLSPRVIRVRRESDGADVPGSPKTITPPLIFDASVMRTLSEALGKYRSDDEIERKIDFFVEETVKLMQGLADRDSGRARRRRDEDYLRCWRWRLTSGEAEADMHRPRSGRRALVIDDTTPKRTRDAGSTAIISHMQSLQRLGFEVAFAAAAEFRIGGVPADTGHLDELGIFSFRPPYYGSIEDAMIRQAGEFDLIYLHRLSNASRYCEMARGYFPRARVLYSVADLHFLRLARQAEAEDSPELMQLSKVTQRRELLAMAAADAVLTHSRFEAELMRQTIRKDRIHVVPWHRPARPATIDFSDRQGVAFVGYYGHQPNLDAARWLIDEIMPLVRKGNPSIECLLVGPDTPKDLERLCGDGCVAVGLVDDLAAMFGRVRLSVAPLAYGAGLKGKVLDSLAAGTPCVCTAIAAEGFDLPAPLRAYVADDASGLAAAILRLHEDREENDLCSRVGLDFVAERFSEAEVDRAMQRAVTG